MTDARFPRYDLESSIEVARQIHQRAAGGTASSNELAEFLGYSSANNGAFLYRSSAARMFGLLEGQSPAVRVSPLALDIIRPSRPQSAQAARLTAFQRVPLYKQFLEDHEGQTLPATPMLRNAIARLGVPEKDSAVALARLLDSAEAAGLFRVAGNRSKMILPTIADVAAEDDSNVPAVSSDAASERDSSSAPTTRFHKMIEGALDILPPDRQWNEEEFAEWLDFFERALRVHYRLPRRGRDTG